MNRSKTDPSIDDGIVPLNILRKAANNAQITSLEFVNQDKTLISGNVNNEIDFWDVDISRCVSTVKIGECESADNSKINKTIYSSFDKVLYVQNKQGELFKMDSIEGNRVSKIESIKTDKLDFLVAKFTCFTRDLSDVTSNPCGLKDASHSSPLFPLVPTKNEIMLLDPRSNYRCEMVFKLSKMNSQDKLMEIETLCEYSFIGGFESGKIAVWDIRKHKDVDENGLIVNKYLNENDKSPIMSIKRAHNRVWISSFNSRIQIYNKNNFERPLKSVKKDFVVGQISTRSDSLVTALCYANNGVIEMFENKNIESIGEVNHYSGVRDIGSICFSNHYTSSLFAFSTNTISLFNIHPDSYYFYKSR